MIRIWKMGDLEKNIIPSEKAVNVLIDILQHLKDDNGNFKDIIWGPDLEVILVPEDSEELAELREQYDLIAVPKAPKVKPEDLDEKAKLDN